MTRRTISLSLRGILVLAALSIFISVKAGHRIDSLRSELEVSSNPDDSLRLLFNIYDLVVLDPDSQNERAPLLNEIFDRSLKANDLVRACESLSLLAAYYEFDDSMQTVIMDKAKALPVTEMTKVTNLYIKVRYISQSMKEIPEEKHAETLGNLFVKYKDLKHLDIYDHIEYLFTICTFLRSTTDGELLITYLHRLENYLAKLPQSSILIKILFYNQAFTSYLNNDMMSAALNANRRVLELLNDYDKQHLSEGREYRNYNGALYFAYHNMLLCSNLLTDAEIEEYYKKLLKLEETTPRLKNSYDLRNRSRIYYLMAKHRYHEALQLIKTQLNGQNSRYEHRRLIIAMIEAAKATGDQETLLTARKENNDILKKRLAGKNDESIRELQILYYVTDLKQDNNQLERDNLTIGNERRSARIIYLAIAIVIVLLMLFETFKLYRKSRTMATKFADINSALVVELDNLRQTKANLEETDTKTKTAEQYKNDFVQNMNQEIRTPMAAIVEYSHLINDYAEEDKRAYIRNYSSALSLNVDLLATLVNDVLELPSLENTVLNIRITPSSLHQICLLAIDLVKKHVAPGVKLLFENSNKNDDVVLPIDPHRVEQVLLNLLLNAAKFTENGTITLGYTFDREDYSVTFTVTDTGIGIPRGKEDFIFGRFQKISSSTQGNGLGLYISRRIATLLNGSLTLDPEYRKGARFIFKFPISPDK